MATKTELLVQGILDNVGGKGNVTSITNCMTRVRMTFKDESKVNEASLKKVEGVMGVVKSGNQYQVVVGPGTSTKVAQSLSQITGVKDTVDSRSFGNADDVKKDMKARYEKPFSKVLKTISSIFIPLIPAFIASGLIMGINNLLKNPLILPGFAAANPALVGLLGIFGQAIFAYMTILVGYNAAKEFGGSPAIGAVMAGILMHPALADITLFGAKLVPGRGGIIAVLLVVFVAATIEKSVRKVMIESLDLILTPLITVLAAGAIAIFILQPLGGAISTAIGRTVTTAIEGGGFLVGALLAGTFLPLVMTGIHQGLTPIHADLIATKGFTILLPILAMAGAGQVGASIAVYVKTKNKRLKKTIASALPVGILGVGEPLIYGVTLPLGKPFLGACIGGACGGAFVAGIGNVGAVALGLSGIPLAAAIASGGAITYLIGVLIAYVGGFAATSLIGFTDPVEEEDDVQAVNPMKTVRA